MQQQIHPLDAYLQSQGVTRRAFADQLGDATAGLVSQWCNGVPIPAPRCVQISLLTGIAVDRLNQSVDWDSYRRALTA